MDFDDIEDEYPSDDEALGFEKSFEDEKVLNPEDDFKFDEDSEESTETQSKETIRDLVPTQQASRSPRAAATRKPRVTLQALLTVIFAAAVVATLLTLWMPSAYRDAFLSNMLARLPRLDKRPNQLKVSVSLPAEFPDNKGIIGNKGRDEGEVAE